LADIIFYQKPGCGTNARQKRALEAAGHTVLPRNLLTEPWTAERLRSFFGDMPSASWINPAAPRVKSGEIDPAKMDSAAALALMLAEPLLIRRPLVEAGGQRSAGFDSDLIASLLADGNERLDIQRLDIQECARLDTATPCPNPNDVREHT
jgi:nitrogenase-associated protein